MRSRTLRSCLALLPVVLAPVLVASTATALELAVGDPAPDFALVGSDGETHRLADHRGKRGVVIAWFPAAFTSGCTAELQDMRDHAVAIAGYDAAVYLASVDTPEKNAAFAKEHGAQQVVLSDPSSETAKAYGVVGPGGLYASRWTFYIDADGRIAEIDKSVSTTTAGQDIARKLGELGFPTRP
jgi:thioredoxin-dependent peroxiredoxin